jgi:hypothetical protein
MKRAKSSESDAAEWSAVLNEEYLNVKLFLIRQLVVLEVAILLMV